MIIYHTIYHFNSLNYDLEKLVCIYIRKTDTHLPNNEYSDNPIILFGNYNKKFRCKYKKIPLKGDVPSCLRMIISDIFSIF